MEQPVEQGTVMVEVGVGELLDKITILEIKNEELRDPAKLANVRTELAVLRETAEGLLGRVPRLAALMAELSQVNRALWRIEDAIRGCEAAGDFGPRFVELARSVYLENDRRAAIKRRMNEASGSRIVEEKAYTEVPLRRRTA